MALMRYEPNDIFRRFTEQMNRMLQQPAWMTDEEGNIVTGDWAPAVDVKEEDNRFVITADVPGVDPKDIEVTMENGMLTMKGERSSEKTTEEGNYRRIERSHGSFYRRFGLPESTDDDKVTAETKNGVLTIIVPKSEKAKAKRITVQG